MLGLHKSLQGKSLNFPLLLIHIVEIVAKGCTSLDTNFSRKRIFRKNGDKAVMKSAMYVLDVRDLDFLRAY